MKWIDFIKQQQETKYFQDLWKFIKNQEKDHLIFPKQENIYACFNYFEVEDTKVIIVGQDPYYLPGLANGLAFAVNKDAPLPKSLINIFKELKDDLREINTDCTLQSWAKQGVLLMNRVMTVNANKPNSHKNKGWEEFTNNVIKLLNKTCNNLVFILWGNNAQELIPLIDNKKHLIISSSHPSPLGYYRSFKGSKPFSKCNEYLLMNNKKIINW